MKKTFKIWWFYTVNSFQQMSANRAAMTIFLFGKIFRILLFFVFLNLIFFSTKSMGGYTQSEAILFYLTFNLIDTAGQLLFREVYRFRSLLVSGDLDLILIKPINPLVRVLLGGADLFDLIILAGLVITLSIYIPNHFILSGILFLGFVIMLINSLLLSAALHICILALGILFISIDHLVMIYRDMTALMRIPADLYAIPLRFFLTFVIPLGIMFSYPPKALLGLLTWQNIIFVSLVSLCLLYLANCFWRWSIRYYSSASS